MQVLTAAKFKEMDKATIEDIGIPGIVLMENAATGIYNKILNKGEKFIVVCGDGNNGGDGLAIARKLILAKKQVKTFVIGNGNSKSVEFNINYKVLCNITSNIELIQKDKINLEIFKNELENSDIIVDAIFGIGLNREVQEIQYKVIEKINESNAEIFSVDIPSGLDSDTGKPLGISIKAKETFTIETYKKGFFMSEAQEYLGYISIINIGIPEEIKELHNEKIEVLSKTQYKLILPKRTVYGHKGNYGRVIILAGSNGMEGAALIATKAALKTGSGLTTLLVNDNIKSIVSSKSVEAMIISYSEKDKLNELISKADIIACGPGLGSEKEQVQMLQKCIMESSCPIVLDADALNIISKNDGLISYLKNRAIFTPHPGEMARLTGKTIKYIEENRIEICREYSKQNNIITLLKGHNTVISDGDKVIINTSGTSKMASGGMGDCLTGIISSLVGQKIGIFNSAILGCYIHGLAAEEAGTDKYSVIASEVIDKISEVMNDIIK